MNVTLPFALILSLLPCVVGCKKERRLADPELRRFVEIKQAQALELVNNHQVHMPAEGWKLFDAIISDDFSTVTSAFARLALERSASTNIPNAASMAVDEIRAMLARRGWYVPTSSALDGAAWQTLSEAHWAYVEAKAWKSPLLRTIVREIVSSVPTNAVYFGGTDVGRFSVTANLEASKSARKFLILTQNQLMDYGYCEYSQFLYKQTLTLPDVRQCSAGWSRLFSTNTNPAPAAVMRENGELLRFILVRNPDREFFIEQDLIIEALYPYLFPHGPIQKISHQALSRLPEEVVDADRQYWIEFCRKYIGDWIKPDSTSVKEVCEFCERVYLHKEVERFSGARSFLADQRAQEYFAKLRLATARLYLWWCVKAGESEEKGRMWKECLFAFEQAFALGPGNSEVATDFADVLTQVQRYDDAVRVLRLCRTFHPSNTQLQTEIERIQGLMAQPR